ncbi:hypothetical protein C4D60_Mb08t28340 [Musa balbisiana]|uniref:Uncharacterized protein n=1 Tax=Musa balbisiana TaxID=52838 RepID=A0A4S8K766_MUSBA|nr:hypothetical protein C4D60_Mb08t28340 [Musa balbisiana]
MKKNQILTRENQKKEQQLSSHCLLISSPTAFFFSSSFFVCFLSSFLLPLSPSSNGLQSVSAYQHMTITKDFNDDKHKNTFYVPQQGSTSAQQYHETGPSKQSPEL